MKYLRITFVVLVLILIGFSSYKIITYYQGNKENEEIKQNIIDKYVEEVVATTPDDVKTEVVYRVDFANLLKENSDTVGYLKVPNTNIEYAVVKGKDNSYYLNHSFNKGYNVSGWIFSDFRNRFDGYDKNIVIFGHNTLDGTMFGTLKNVLNKDWYENNKYVYLSTPNGEYIYEVFSVYTVYKEDYYIQTEFSGEFDKFVNTIKGRSIYNFNVEVGEQDHILTLSTCTSDHVHRTVLHAKSK